MAIAPAGRRKGIDAMNRTRTDRILRRIERALVALGFVCLMWVGAISMHALTYQVEQHARLARLAPPPLDCTTEPSWTNHSDGVYGDSGLANAICSVGK
jgi:hypothetical protein